MADNLKVPNFPRQNDWSDDDFTWINFDPNGEKLSLKTFNTTKLTLNIKIKTVFRRLTFQSVLEISKDIEGTLILVGIVWREMTLIGSF